MSFYLSLFVFIASLIAGLALMIAGKDMKRDRFLLLSALHGIFLFGFIASILLKKNDSENIYNYFFMAFVCSGIILSGLSWRSQSPFALRIYFSIFILTIPMFLFSPSMLLNFLLTMNYSSTSGPVFQVTGRYFIERQTTTTSADGIPHYKLIVKKGMFHETILRDIIFGGTLDSLRLIEFEKGIGIKIRGYTSRTTHVSMDVDSADVEVTLISNKPGSVEYHL